MTEVRVRREVVLDASVEEVWRALTDDTELSAWFGGEVRLDPVPGGRGVFEEQGVVRHAVVEELDEERRLVLRWSAPGEADSRVVFTIGDGHDGDGTRLTVEETPVTTPSASASATSSSAWAMRLAGLQLRFALQPVTC